MDKRVVKTKRTIKRTLVELLVTMPFEKITVTELCRAADVSRITFYTYYDDKYALADELFRDDMAKAEERYRELQAENNPRKIPTNSYHNLLTCIFSVFEQRDGIFIHCSSTKNPYLHSACFNHVVRVVENYVQNPLAAHGGARVQRVVRHVQPMPRPGNVASRNKEGRLRRIRRPSQLDPVLPQCPHRVAGGVGNLPPLAQEPRNAQRRSGPQPLSPHEGSVRERQPCSVGNL